MADTALRGKVHPASVAAMSPSHSGSTHQQSLFRREALPGLAVALVLSGLIMAITSAGLLEARWRDRAFGWLAQHAPVPAKAEVVVVGLHTEDLDAFQVPIALMHRQIAAFLQGLVIGGARAAGLDFTLPERSFDALSPGLDQALAQALVAVRGGPPVVLGIGVRADGQPEAMQPLLEAVSRRLPRAYLVVNPDADGMIRGFDERLGNQGERLPTLGGEVARVAGAPPRNGLIHYAHGDAVTLITWRQVVAWVQAQDQAALQAALGDRVVLLGNLLPFDDQLQTPVPLTAGGTFTGTSHGVLIHAQQIRNLLDDTLVRELSWPLAWLALALLTVLGAWRTGALAWASALGLAVAVLLASVYLLRESWAIPAVAWAIAPLIGVGVRTGHEAWDAAQERNRLRQHFSGLVSPAVLREIVAGRLDPQAGGGRREIAVLFSDIRGFTTLSETMAPEQVVELLNRYFGLMVSVIHRHGGTLDKFIGDGIMAVFGSPATETDDADRAWAAARDMLAALGAFNAQQRALGGPVLQIGIGLHAGPAVTGFVGSATRFEFSAVGDTVNTASRIESLTKEAGYPLLVSEAARARLSQPEGLVDLGPMAVRGRAAMRIFGYQHPRE
jgi:adenylate cyclase